MLSAALHPPVHTWTDQLLPVCVCACAYVCVGGYRGQPLIRTITLRQKLSTASVFFSSTLYDTHACTHRHTRTHARTHTQTHTHTHTHTHSSLVCAQCAWHRLRAILRRRSLVWPWNTLTHWGLFLLSFSVIMCDLFHIAVHLHLKSFRNISVRALWSQECWRKSGLCCILKFFWSSSLHISHHTSSTE